MGHFDAIAIGGGLAGAAFALELARAGQRVAVIERTGVPTLKVCGDFLSGEAQALLDHLGLDVARMGAPAIRTLRIVAGERRASAELPFRGAGLSRLKLDEALLEAAAAAGAELIRGEGASALEPAGDLVRVRVGGKTLTARCAALATGKHNLRGWPRAPGKMTAYKIQLAPTPRAAELLADVVQLVGYRGGYIGACSVEQGEATICWLLDARVMREIGSDWRAHLDYIARRSSALGDLLAGARFLSARPTAVSGIPYGYRRTSPIAPNIYALGDQLCVIPSFTGDGTSLALSSGVAGARACLSGTSAGAFQQAFLQHVRAQFFWARAVDGVFKSALTRSLGVLSIAAAPGLARLAAGLTRVRNWQELGAGYSSSTMK